MRNNKGLSTVVTTLIIILLVLVAVGIIWGVVNNLLNKTKGKIQSSAECFDLDVSAVNVLPVNESVTPGDDYKVFLKRSAGGTDNTNYAKVAFSDAGGTSVLKDFTTGILPLETKSMEFNDTTVFNATKVEVTAYYTDEIGRAHV